MSAWASFAQADRRRAGCESGQRLMGRFFADEIKCCVVVVDRLLWRLAKWLLIFGLSVNEKSSVRNAEEVNRESKTKAGTAEARCTV